MPMARWLSLWALTLLHPLAPDAAVAATLPLEVGDILALNLTGEELMKRAEEALSRDDTTLAVRLSTAAVANYGHDGLVFNNLGVALATHGSERGDAELLCEAHAAAELAWALGHARGAVLAPAVAEALPPAGCKHWLLEPEVMLRLLQGTVPASEQVELLGKLCTRSELVAVRPTKREKAHKAWTVAHLHQLWVLLRVCGVVVVEDVLDAEVLAEVARAQASLPSEAGGGGPAVALQTQQTFKGTDTASRGSLRQEMRLPLRMPFQHPELTAAPLLRSLVKVALGERVELDTFSCIVSAPGSADQDWHNDVPTPQAPCHMRPVGLVAVVPLVAVTPENGATEFLAGSHVQSEDEGFWIEGEGFAAAPKLQPRLRVGSVALFDIRARHRGRANWGSENRTILYMSYVQEWFRDGINFKERQTRAWDNLTGSAQRLFARLDAREYIAQLERELVERGVDLGTLRSGMEYRQGHLEL